MHQDSTKETEQHQKEEKVDVPRRVNWEIKDLVHPITVRRITLWRAGVGLVLLIAVAVVAWLLFFRAPSGDALIGKAVAAAGGMDAWNNISEGYFTRNRTVYDESEVPIHTEQETFYFQQGEEFRLVIEAHREEGHVIIGRDNDGYWATIDGQEVDAQQAAQEMGMMCDSEYCTPLCSAEMAFYRFTLPFKLTDPGVNARYAGAAALQTASASVVDVTFDPDVGSDRWVFHMDKNDHLIRKVEHYPDAEESGPPEEIYWSDFQEKDGITFSHRRSYYRSNGTLLEEYEISEANFSDAVPEERFERPAGLDTAEAMD